MTDAEWILKHGPQRFRPSPNGMVHANDGLFVHYQDFVLAVAHLEAKLKEIGDTETLTAETPKEKLARIQRMATDWSAA